MRIAITSSALRALADVGKTRQTRRALAGRSAMRSGSSVGPTTAAVPRADVSADRVIPVARIASRDGDPRTPAPAEGEQ